MEFPYSFSSSNYQAVLRHEQDNKNLANFILPFEVYFGCDEAGHEIGTAYIWMSFPELEIFDKICEDIHHHPTTHPEDKLFLVMKIIRILTTCVQDLHGCGLIHRDITPSNFGLTHLDDETLSETIMFSDVDSICELNKADGILGTGGFMEPEATRAVEHKHSRYRATFQTDIYSIGAILFYAVIVTDSTKKNGFRYQEDDYANIEELVRTSALISASEDNSHPKLRYYISKILKKCLCNRKYRYTNCGELLEDINAACFYTRPPAFAQKSESGDRWILADAKTADAHLKKNSMLAIQYHLYEHPLYESLPKAETPMSCNTMVGKTTTTKNQTIQILIVGFDNYGQKYLDACLAACQIPGYTIRATVMSSDMTTDQEIYLSERPKLANFFTIDSEENNTSKNTSNRSSQNNSSGSNYGSILFSQSLQSEKDSKPEDKKQILENLQKSIKEFCKNTTPHDIFIALDNDELNLETTNTCMKAAQEYGTACQIHYVCEGITRPQYSPAKSSHTNNTSHACMDNSSTEKISILHPVYVNADIAKLPLYSEIERMAFNTHLIWEKSLNVNHAALRQDYLKPYNHISSVASVLSIKYKLYSMGIDLAECDFETAARRFSDIMKDPNASVLPNTDSEKTSVTATKKGNFNFRDELICAEHRRWVTEKICQGWKRREIKDCMDGSTKDERHRLHVCILKSNPEQKLEKPFWTNNNHQAWEETKTQKNLEDLDELDSMSVKLHQEYCKAAAEQRKENPLSGEEINKIQKQIAENKAATAAFQEWYSCMKEILNENKIKNNYNNKNEDKNQNEDSSQWSNRSSIPLYKNLKNAFLNTVKDFDKRKVQIIRAAVSELEAKFYPILASQEYRDFKQDDTLQIDNIPFVLTYSKNIYMVIPYISGKNRTMLFSNVAAPTVINPGRILYLYYDEYFDPENLIAFRESIPYVLEYMNKKNIRSIIDLLIFYPLEQEATVSKILGLQTTNSHHEGKPAAEENSSTTWKQNGKKKINLIKTFPYEDISEVSSTLEHYLKTRCTNKRILALEHNGTSLSGIMNWQSNQLFSHYTFSQKRMEFSTYGNSWKNNHCEIFRYITKKPYLTVADMFSLSKTYSRNSNMPEYYDDYMKLWNRYQGLPDEQQNSSNVQKNKSNTQKGKSSSQKNKSNTQNYSSSSQNYSLNSCPVDSDAAIGTWKALCTCLSKHSKGQDSIATFSSKNPIDTGKAAGLEKHTYYLPSACQDNVSKIVELLQKKKILDTNSTIQPHTSDSIRLDLSIRPADKGLYDQLFAHVYSLMLPGNITVYYDSHQQTVNVQANHLSVSDVIIKSKEQLELLQWFCENGYITNLQYKDSDPSAYKVSFTYATPEYKELLTTGGKMLEVYTFHSVKNFGWFDDVVSSHEIEWEDTDVKNEFDCILTKGFRSLFVECKATKLIEQNYYSKLSQLTSQFGVNAIPVLIADTRGKSDPETEEANKKQIKRGKMENVVTVSDPKDINDIGNTLRQIMEGTYQPRKNE